MKQLILLTLAVFFFIPVSRVFAQDAMEKEVTDTIKEHVQRVIESGNKVAGTSTETKTFGIVGTLEKSIGSSLQIKTYSGQMRVIELAKDVVLLRANRPIQKEELELNTPVIVMGTLDESETYSAKRLIVSDESIFPAKRRAIWATFTSSTTRLLKTKALGENGGQTLDIPLTSQTQFFNVLGNKINRTELKALDPMIIILPDTPGATASARKVYSLKLTASPLP